MHVRRDLGSIAEEDGEVHDIVEGIVAFCALEWSRRILCGRYLDAIKIL